jgi:hypothetical protein
MAQKQNGSENTKQNETLNALPPVGPGGVDVKQVHDYANDDNLKS